MTGISTPNVPAASAVDELLGNRTADGLTSTVRVAVTALAAQILADGPLATQLTGLGAEIDGIAASTSAEIAAQAAAAAVALAVQAARIDELEDAQGGSLIAAATWTALLAIAGTYEGQAAEVASTDAGTHLQATVSGYNGASVANAGRYAWNDTWDPWVWISADGLSLKADKSATVATRPLPTGEARADRSLSVTGDVDVAESRPGDTTLYTPPPAEIISPRAPLLVTSPHSILLGDSERVQIGTDPVTHHPIINGRGVVPASFPPGTVIADSAGFLRAMDARTPRYAGEWEPDLEFIRANDPPTVLFDLSDPYYAVRTFQFIATIERVGARLWCAFYGSPTRTDEGPPSYIIVKYSDDGGVTWVTHAYVAYVDGNGDPIETKRCVDPRFFVDADGLLWLLVPVSSGTSTYDNIFGTFAFVIRDADGPNPIWDKPFQLCPYGIAARPYWAGERLLIPIDVWRQSTGLNPGKAGKHLYELDTRRRAATRIGTLPDMDAPTYDESSGVQLRNGDLLHMFRTSYGQSGFPGTHSQWFSRSYDGGHSWTTPAVFSQIPGNPPARAIMRRSPKGRILVLSCASVHPTRNNMTLSLSEDEGATFPVTCLLDGVNPYTAYPEMCFGANGEIHATYDGRYTPPARPIYLASVDEDDAWANGNAATITRRVIDSL